MTIALSKASTGRNRSTTAEVTADRTTSLRKTLNDLKSELARDVRGRIRDTKIDQPGGVVDHVEGSADDARQGLDLALLEMRSNTLSAIDDAIARLDAGSYGLCFECDGPIALRRLQALPFAVRCRECEEDQEQPAARRRSTPRFSDLVI